MTNIYVRRLDQQITEKKQTNWKYVTSNNQQ